MKHPEYLNTKLKTSDKIEKERKINEQKTDRRTAVKER